MSSKSVLEEARALPLAEQIELCCNLWEDIASSKELSAEEAALIDLRLQDHIDHPDDLIPWEEVKAKFAAKRKQ